MEITVSYSETTSAWNIEGKNLDVGNVRSNTTYGTRAMNAYKIVEETLNLKTVKIHKTVTDADGRETRTGGRRGSWTPRPRCWPSRSRRR